MKFFLLLVISTSAYSNEISNPKDKEAFFGKTFSSNLPTKEQIKRPLVKENDCVKAIKDEENFWNHDETPVLKVEAIGDKKIKLRKFIFLKKQKDHWYADESALALPFELQDEFEITECPKEEFKLSDEQIEKFKKKQ